MTHDASLAELNGYRDVPVSALGEVFGTVSDLLGERDDEAALETLVNATLELVQADWAVLSIRGRWHLTHTVATSGTARSVDAVEQTTGSGPLHDVLHGGAACVMSDDAAADPRWPGWSAALPEPDLTRAVMVLPCHPHDAAGTSAALTLGSSRPRAFRSDHRAIGLVVARHLSLLLDTRLAAKKGTELAKALWSNREIGVAVGIIMSRTGLARDDAFELLRRTSQDTNTKVIDLATYVADTGAVPSTDDLGRLAQAGRGRT